MADEIRAHSVSPLRRLSEVIVTDGVSNNSPRLRHASAPYDVSERRRRSLSNSSSTAPIVIIPPTTSTDQNPLKPVTMEIDEIASLKIEDSLSFEGLTLLPTGLVYDERMLQHQHMTDKSHPECPDRLTAVYRLFNETMLLSHLKRLSIQPIDREQLLLFHSAEYCDKVNTFPSLEAAALSDIAKEYNSIYLHPSSMECAKLAVGGVLSACRAVANQQCRNAVALVRPPGHHAEADHAMGFCIFNNVAVAARAIQRAHPKIKRILIVDWDVHHGNGTQSATFDDASILYVSLHRHEYGSFYPHQEEAGASFIGSGDAKGYNVNIAWQQAGMGDSEYLYAMDRLIIPIGQAFSPDLVIVSAGFDAAAGDPIGGNRVTPTGYAQMTHRLMSLARGKLVLALEGGYNTSVVAKSLVACTRVLLGHAPPAYHENDLVGDVLAPAKRKAVVDVETTLRYLSPYWPQLRPHYEQWHTEKSCLVPAQTLLDAYWQSWCLSKSLVPCSFLSADVRLQQSCQGHVFMNDSFLNEKCLFILLHGSGTLVHREAMIKSHLDARHVILWSPAQRYAETALRRGYGFMSVHFQFHDLYSREEEDVRLVEQQKAVCDQLLYYLHEHYWKPAKAQQWFIVAMNGLVYSVGEWLNQIQDDESLLRVSSLHLIPPMMPPPMITRKRMNWYLDHSQVIVPSALKAGEVVRQHRQFGHCISSGYEDVTVFDRVADENLEKIFIRLDQLASNQSGPIES